MLKPRRANMLVMRVSAPGLFSTRTDERVLHADTVSSAGYSTTSSAAAPAGIIGKQCSRGSTRASTTHGPAGRERFLAAPRRAPPRSRR